MKTKLLKLLPLLIIAVTFLFLHSCKEETITPVQPPASPSNLSGSAISSSQINLTWTDNSNDEKGFIIERAPGGTTNFTKIAEVSANIKSYQNTSLNAATNYSYRVCAFNDGGHSGFCNVVTVQTLSSQSNIPSAPSSLSAIAMSSSQINLSWADNSNDEQGFKVERAPGGTTNFSEIATLSSNITSYQNTGLTASTIYSYRVRAYNTSGNSGYSNTANATTNSANATAPTVTTTAVTNPTTNSASGGGNVTSQGSSNVTTRGVCWSTSQNPTTSNSKTVDGSGTGSFTSSITGLSPSTTYYVRAYATNSVGTSYGSQVSFATTSNATAPTVTTTAITNPTTNSATGGGNVTSQGSSTVTARGVCWSTSQNPTTSNSKTVDGSGTGSFTSSITGLSPSTTYYVRAYATNSVGTSYGNQVSFVTQGQAQVPGISAPSTSTGTFVVSVTYNWTTLVSNFDGYELFESTSPTSGFVKIMSSPAGTHTSPYNFSVTRSSGTYYYKARVYVGSGPNPGYSPYSSVVSVTVTQQQRQITIINNAKSTNFLADIVRVKVAATQNGVYTRNDLLTPDPASCLSLPGESIAPNNSRTFNITIGNNYSVFIGIGKWDLNSITCPTHSPWFKRNYTTDVNWNNHYFWVVVNVTGHSSDNWNWTISGDYTISTLKVTPAGNNSIFFNHTSSDPIP